MANYPTEDPSFTTKTDGVDYPQAAHINDLQAEVTAIGAALRAGLAHALAISNGGLTVSTGSVNVGGPSSLATLQVNGGSTFAGDVVFSSTVTFNGPTNFSAFADPITLSSGAVVSTGVLRQNSLPAWSLHHSTHVAYGANSTAGAVFDTQDLVRGSVAHSTAANSSRVTIGTTGLYYIAARAHVHSGVNPFVRGTIVLNDATALLESVTPTLGLGGGSSQGTLQVDGLIHMSDAGYLTFQIASESAASTAGSSTPARALRFQGWFLG